MYGRLFASIFDSSIMEEEMHVRYLFQCMIALADEEGVVDLTRHALARRVNMPLTVVNEGLERLMSPDPQSRSPLENGARLVPIRETDWGWRLVNHAGYREIVNSSDRKTYMREYMRRRRAKEEPVNTALTDVNDGKEKVALTVAVTETDTTTEGTLFESSAPPPSVSAAGPIEDVEVWIPFEGKQAPKAAKLGPWRAANRDGARWEYGVTRELIANLAGLYPSVDIAREVRAYADWSERHPAKRKTYSGSKCGVLDSLHFWLDKRQNANGGGSPSRPQFGHDASSVNRQYRRL